MKGNRWDCMDDFDFDLDIEYKKAKECLDSEEYYRLKEKDEKKNVSQKEHKIYIKLNNIRNNIDFLDNIMNYINDMKHEIKKIQKEKENRKKYREFQGKRRHLNTLIEDEEKEAKALGNTLLCEQLYEKEKTYIEGQINASLKEIAEMKEKIKEIEAFETEYEKLKTKYPVSPEEQREIIIEIQEKIKQYSVVAEKLIRGHTFDEALEYLISWQKDRYKLEKTNINTIHKDMEEIRSDKEIGNEIIKIAYHYNERKGEDRG